MKVLVIDNSRWWGGAEKNLQALIDDESTGNAIEFSVLSDYQMAHNAVFGKFCNVRYRFRNPYFAKWLDSRYKIRALRAIRLIHKSLYLIVAIIRDNPSIVHFNLYRSSDKLDIIVCKLLRKKVVLHIQSLANRVKVDPLTIRLADAVICVSESVKKGFAFVGDKYHVIYNGIDRKYYDHIRQNDARKRLNLNSRSIIIGSIGNLEREKGHDVAVKALKKIIDDGYQRITLIIVGKDPKEDKSETKRLEALCKASEVQDRVKIFSVSPEDMRYAYSACDIVLSLCLDGEAFGMVPVEAALCDRPVIATNVGACTETIIDKETGLLCEPNSPDRLAQSIKILLDDRGFYYSIVKCAKKRILEKYSASVYRNKITDIYKDILIKRSA